MKKNIIKKILISVSFILLIPNNIVFAAEDGEGCSILPPVKDTSVQGQIKLTYQQMPCSEVNGVYVDYEYATVTSPDGTISEPIANDEGFIRIDVTQPGSYTVKRVNVYHISYDLDGGSYENDLSNPEVFIENNDVIALTNPYKEGYDFLGWYLDGQKIDSIPANSNRDYLLVAKWIPNGIFVVNNYRCLLNESIDLVIDYSINPNYLNDVKVFYSLNNSDIAHEIQDKQVNGNFSVKLDSRNIETDIHIWANYSGSDTIKDILSVSRYCESIINGSYSNETKLLAKSILDYGKNATAYFDNKSGGSYSLLTDELKTKLDAYQAVIRQKGEESSLLLNKTSLRLNNTIDLCIYYDINNETQHDDYQFNVSCNDLEIPSNRIEISDDLLVIKNIKALELSNIFTIQIKSGNNMIVDMNYSPMSYVNTVINRPTSSKNLINVCLSLFEYGEMASNYSKTNQ